ncbi:MAG: hypothetical protein M1819_005848 [Sarea resinae]|nr:MAG: hypothetical protein M1819_005848 [Sarea resinae]
MSGSYVTQRVISEGSLQLLLAAGEAGEVNSGFRAVSRASFGSGSSTETVQVPEHLMSASALVFCGFDATVADQIFNKWVENEENYDEETQFEPEDLITLARHYVKTVSRTTEAWLPDPIHSWDGVLQAQGISENTRARILHPDYRELRLTGTASYWALDTIDLCWEFLEDLDGRIIQKKQESARVASPDPNIQPSAALRPTLRPTLTQAIHGPRPIYSLLTEAIPPSQVDGCMILYKGGSYERFLSVFRPDGTLNLEPILSRPPTDFHPAYPLLYFTKHIEVAQKYASYVALRIPPEEAGIMYVAVPREIMEGQRSVYHPDWRDIIWHSRNRHAYTANAGRLPPSLRTYEQAPVLVGDICGQATSRVSRMSDQSQLEPLRLRSGGRATQVVFQSPEMISVGFAREVQGRLWVSSTRAPDVCRYVPRQEE